MGWELLFGEARQLRSSGYRLYSLAVGGCRTEKCGEEIDPIPEMERLRLVERGFCKRKNPRQRIVDVISRGC
jgi:hypothetical protein